VVCVCVSLPHLCVGFGLRLPTRERRGAGPLAALRPGHVPKRMREWMLPCWQGAALYRARGCAVHDHRPTKEKRTPGLWESRACPWVALWSGWVAVHGPPLPETLALRRFACFVAGARLAQWCPHHERVRRDQVLGQGGVRSGDACEAQDGQGEVCDQALPHPHVRAVVQGTDTPCLWQVAWWLPTSG
jgi:hypothetical protein